MILLGGYAYRLCRVPSDGVSAITEDCFENGHLDFAKDKKSYVFHLPKGRLVLHTFKNGVPIMAVNIY